MLIQIFVLVVGFVILIKGADIFVDGASSIAGNFKVSKMLIGLTIVSFGTSAPELAVSVKSIISGNHDIVLGNVIGSNILNILLIVGLSAMVHSLNVKNNTVKKELPIVILISTLFGVLLLDKTFDKSIVNNAFTRSDGIVLLLFFLVFVYFLFSMMRNKVETDEKEEYMPLIKAFLFTFGGILLVVLGSNFVVDSASLIASRLGISAKMISLTIIALGTSLPELVTSIQATRKGEYDIAIGNVIGSNIFNIGIVVGVPVALFGGISKINFNYIDIIAMILSAVLLFIFSYRKYKITKSEGIVFLLIFLAYYSYIIYMG